VTEHDRAQLADKYRRMAALRASLPADRPPDAAARALMKQLAREFPGALRELDSLPTDEIERRCALLESGPLEPWMRWLHRYHELMRAALKLRAHPELDPAALGIDDQLARAFAAPAHGRLMVAVFDRLALEEKMDRGALWDALFPPRKGPRDYRRR
jgi:hypothetical protein